MQARRRRQQPDQTRARTVEPQARNAVFSYHANRSVREGVDSLSRESLTKQVPRKNHAVKHFVQRLPVILAFGAIAVCLLTILSLTKDVKVVSVTSNNPSTRLFLRDTSTYQRAAQKLFAASPFNKNKLTVDTTYITSSLRQQFPELQSVSIALPIVGRRPIVYVQPANPVLFLTTQGGGVYILDTAGRALVGGEEATRQTTQLHIPTVHDASGVAVRIGQVALPSNDVDFIIQIVEQLQAKSLQITSLDLPAGASELDVRFQGVSYAAKFNMQGSAREQAGTFLAAKQYLEGHHTAPSAYIDARVPGRTYYR